MKEKTKFFWIAAIFAGAWFLPADSPRLAQAVGEALAMLSEYAREHVLLCLVPAFFIAGAISVFVSQQGVIRYLGRDAKKWVAYSVASVSGTILAVCSCTVLPLFAGIYKRGAGLGPATAFLYSGPAINILSIVLTARVLGVKLGIARGIGAIIFSVIIGMVMEKLFKNREKERFETFWETGEEPQERPLWKTALPLAGMVVFLVFANWGAPRPSSTHLWGAIHAHKWQVALVGLATTLITVALWFSPKERLEWGQSSWEYALQVMPLLFAGVLVAGFLLGRPEHPGLIPETYISTLVGGNSVFANFFASLAGALMYFATLTEVPILQGLMGAGMGDGPALALLLAGPALSLPNMLVIRSVLGTKQTLAYVGLVVIMSTTAGIFYGMAG